MVMNNIKLKQKLEITILAVIIILAFTVRLYRFNNPIADWHAWRQGDTSAVSRNFVAHGFDLLHPQYDDISNVQTGVDNPKGYRFLEFPLYNLFQAGGFVIFGVFTLEEWGRLVTILISMLAIVFVYLIGKRYANSTVGFISAAFFAFVPYNIYYDRTILPDPAMTMAILGGIYFFGKWIDTISNFKFQISNEKGKGNNENKSRKGTNFSKASHHNGDNFSKVSEVSVQSFSFLLLAIIFTACALLFKPFAIFFVLPMVYLAYKRFGWKMILRWELWVFTILSVAPLAWWRLWMQQYPEGIPSNTWLFNGGNVRFTRSYFRWVFGLRIGGLISGWFGLLVLAIGFIKRPKTDMLFFYSFALSALVYILVIARGNLQHDYYQIIIIPTIAFFFGLGGDYLLHARSKLLPNLSVGIGIFAACVLVGWWIAWYQVRDYFNINNPSLIVAGKAVDRLTPKNALVIAPLDGDTTFLYQTKRKGWPSFEHSLPDLIQLGADYLVLANPQPKDYDIGKTYKIVSANKDYILFDLHKKP